MLLIQRMMTKNQFWKPQRNLKSNLEPPNHPLLSNSNRITLTLKSNSKTKTQSSYHTISQSIMLILFCFLTGISIQIILERMNRLTLLLKFLMMDIFNLIWGNVVRTLLRSLMLLMINPLKNKLILLPVRLKIIDSRHLFMSKLQLFS